MFGFSKYLEQKVDSLGNLIDKISQHNKIQEQFVEIIMDEINTLKQDVSDLRKVFNELNDKIALLESAQNNLAKAFIDFREEGKKEKYFG